MEKNDLKELTIKQETSSDITCNNTINHDTTNIPLKDIQIPPILLSHETFSLHAHENKDH